MNPRRRPSIDPLIVLAIIALLPALALFGLWRSTAGSGEGAEPPPISSTSPGAPSAALTTPLLSFRRTPAVLSRDVSVGSFTIAVNEFAGSLNDTSCVAVQLDGMAVASANADLALIPASNQKLLTAGVALEILGPDHTYTTELRAAVTPAGGSLAGDLYLVGGGDPLLTSGTYPVVNDPNPVTSPTSLDALADAIAASGITQITGSVIGDGSRYDDEFFAPSWDPDVRGIEAGPYDALMVNDARVTGDDLRADDPNEAAARELVALLQARGVSVTGGADAGPTPAEVTQVVGSVTSAPMTEVVGEMLSASDNNTAELLVKEIGAVAGSGGTREAGLAVMARTLTEWGITETVLADGSGLSNDNRVTCHGLAEVLSRHTPDDAFGAGLPVAGESGTLTDIFTDSPVAGRLRAKTGTLGNLPFNVDPPAVKSLSGYLPVDGGSTVEFALVLNGAGTLADQSVYRPIWDALAATLAEYPVGATPAELQPR